MLRLKSTWHKKKEKRLLNKVDGDKSCEKVNKIIARKEAVIRRKIS